MAEALKSNLFRIYQILCKYTDVNHTLTQEQIKNILEREYDVKSERKAISRNLHLLQDMGFEIESEKRGGWYLSEKQFEPYELRFLIDSVLSSRHISETHSKDLIEKLVKIGGVYFKPSVKHIYTIHEWDKIDSQGIFFEH